MTRPYLQKAKTTEWGTPDWLFDQLNAEFRFTVDAAASLALHRCPRYWTKAENGLHQPWAWDERVFCNPPWDAENLTAFTNKARQVMSALISVLILPAKTDQHWWHDNVLPCAERRWINGRVAFQGASGTYAGGVVVAIYRPGVPGFTGPSILNPARAKRLEAEDR